MSVQSSIMDRISTIFSFRGSAQPQGAPMAQNMAVAQQDSVKSIGKKSTASFIDRGAGTSSTADNKSQLQSRHSTERSKHSKSVA